MQYMGTCTSAHYIHKQYVNESVNERDEDDVEVHHSTGADTKMRERETRVNTE